MDSVNVAGMDIFYYDNGCNVENWLKQGQLFGAQGYEVLSALMLEDGLIVDAGAHVGTFSVVPVLQGRKVLLIEGSARNVECLNATFAGKADVHHAILADSLRRCSFSRDGGPFGWMVEDPNGGFTTNTIDNIVGDRHIAALKLDIEGGEILALDGAKKTLSRSKPPIVMEVNGYCLMQHGHRSEDLLKKVAEHGYVSFINMSQEGAHILRVDPEKLFPFCNIDVMCIHKDNLNNYVFGGYNSIPEDAIEGIANYVCSKSNDDCKAYFKSIGIQ